MKSTKITSQKFVHTQYSSDHAMYCILTPTAYVVYYHCHCRNDPLIHLNYTVALCNCGEKRAAAKHFAQLEANIQNMKERDIDAEVSHTPLMYHGPRPLQ